jgi:hypothetical protein
MVIVEAYSMTEVVHIGSLTDSVRISETELVVVQDLSFDQWSNLMETLSKMDTAFQFALGDALNYGQSRYGERYAQAIECTGKEYQSLANYAWVSKAVPGEVRVAGLSWTHHRLVARLEPSEQSFLLQKAKAEQWTVSALQEVVTGKPVSSKASEHVSIPKGMTPTDAERILKVGASCAGLCEACPYK